LSSSRVHPQGSQYFALLLLSFIIIIVHYATKAAHRQHAQNNETIKHKNTKSTKTKILRLR